MLTLLVVVVGGSECKICYEYAYEKRIAPHLFIVTTYAQLSASQLKLATVSLSLCTTLSNLVTGLKLFPEHFLLPGIVHPQIHEL